ncbi:Gamma-aminobutyric acid type B receptor subunit 1, partial [Frankliniella fusca]
LVGCPGPPPRCPAFSAVCALLAVVVVPAANNLEASPEEVEGEGSTTRVLLCSRLDVLRINSAYSGCTPCSPGVLRAFSERSPSKICLFSGCSPVFSEELRLYSGCALCSLAVLRLLRLYSEYSD